MKNQKNEREGSSRNRCWDDDWHVGVSRQRRQGAVINMVKNLKAKMGIWMNRWRISAHKRKLKEREEKAKDSYDLKRNQSIERKASKLKL